MINDQIHAGVEEILRKIYGTDMDIVRTCTGGYQRHPVGRVGNVFEIQDPRTVNIGDCWMKNRLLPHDLCLCIRHSGDCFQDYVLVRISCGFIKAIRASRFGAYGLKGAKRVVGLHLSTAQIALLLAGDNIRESEVTGADEPQKDKPVL